MKRDQEARVDDGLLSRMKDAMYHRGPDDSGIYVNGNVGLGHRRLSIIDLKNGHQPMVHDEKKRALVYNGEIYNYQGIKEALEKKGEKFFTSCDTEVLLHLVDHRETKWLDSLNGMFAFASWDEESRLLVLGRDRLGIKPLYYMDLGDEFIFASEIKALLIHPKASREVNVDRIPEYLAFRGIAGNETLFKGINQVPPGHMMILKPGSYKPAFVKFWSEGHGNDISTYADADEPFEEQFLGILTDAVRLRLISDVPLGTFNSGGLDSSLVTAIVRSLNGGDLHSFSVGFEEKRYDETKYAEIVARRNGTIHHSLVMNEQDYSRELTETLWHLEEPINHAHTIQILHLSRLAKEYVTVVLTGEGSDEVFAGYPRYRIPLLQKCLRPLLSGFAGRLVGVAGLVGARRVTKLLELVNAKEEDMAVDNSRFVPLSDFRRLFLDPDWTSHRKSIYKDSVSEDRDIMQRLLHYEQRSYLSSLLMRLDKTSMAASIEARVPFLDYRLIEWSYLIPTNVKLKRLTNKWIVKKAAERSLPRKIVHRKKVGFGVPVNEWLRNPRGLGRYLELLTDSTARDRGYLDHRAVEELVNEHRAGKGNHGEVLWGLLNLELWQRMFIDSDGINGPSAVGF